jgi:hypothetical protein
MRREHNDAGEEPTSAERRQAWCRRGVTSVLLAGVVLLGFAAAALALRGGSGDAIVMRVGDTMQVEGAPIGCQVDRRDGRPVIDCRRAGKLAGTYTALFDERRVRVARFRSSDTARVVFTAKHRGATRECDKRGRR